MDANQYQLAQYMRSLGYNYADPNHRAQFLQQVGPQPVYATSRTGPPVNVSQGWFATETRGIFVGNLNYKANEEAIAAYFIRAGPIVSVDLIRDLQTKKSKGTCIIHFDSAKSAQIAIAMFHHKLWMDKRLHVRYDRECTPLNAPSAGPAATAQASLSAQSAAAAAAAARNVAPPLIVSSTPTQSRRVPRRGDGQK